MITEATLKGILLSLAQNSFDDIERIIDSGDSLDDDERALIRRALDGADDAPGMARAIGDAVRKAGDIDFLANECYRAAFYLGDGLPELRENALFNYFSSKRTGRILDKWIHYFPVYTEQFERYRGKPVRILEIGVYRGGSLDMWRWWFGPDAVIVGVDIDERAREVAAPDHLVVLGDQTDPEFLRSLAAEHGPFDIVIDDGGHEMQQQIVTAETLFPLIADGGVLLTEDCHTSYWEAYQGGTGRPGTFIEWCKSRVDDVNGYHRPGEIDRVWTDTVDSIAFYDSIVVVRKKQRYAPFAEQVGHSEFLLLPRFSAQHVTEVTARRDAAIAQRDQARAQLAEDRGVYETELARLRAELDQVRAEAAHQQAAVPPAAKVIRDAGRVAAARLSGRRNTGD